LFFPDTTQKDTSISLSQHANGLLSPW